MSLASVQLVVLHKPCPCECDDRHRDLFGREESRAVQQVPRERRFDPCPTERRIKAVKDWHTNQSKPGRKAYLLVVPSEPRAHRSMQALS